MIQTQTKFRDAKRIGLNIKIASLKGLVPSKYIRGLKAHLIKGNVDLVEKVIEKLTDSIMIRSF